MNFKNVSIVISIIVLATSIFFVSRSCNRYSEAMAALNANPDYLEYVALDDASSYINGAEDELEYTPERVWHDSHTRCNHRDEDGHCTSHSTYWETHRTPEDCPDPSHAKSGISKAINKLKLVGGGEEGINRENEWWIKVLTSISNDIFPNGIEVCYINGYHVSESTFYSQRSSLNDIERSTYSHGDEHYAKVPEDLKSKRNWSIFGIIISILGIVSSIGFGGFIISTWNE